MANVSGGSGLSKLKAPFPWFGGKSHIAHKVWEAFGNVAGYVEPFFGSGAALLPPQTRVQSPQQTRTRRSLQAARRMGDVFGSHPERSRY